MNPANRQVSLSTNHETRSSPRLFCQGWSHYHDTDKPAWEYYASHPEMARRFAGAMSAFANGHGNSPSFLAQGYPWASIGSGTVVDVGGSKGNVSVLLAQSYPNLSFIVQDLPI